MNTSKIFTRFGMLLIAIFLGVNISRAQPIWPPEGVNIPGDWNGWTNYPAAGPFLSNVHTGGTNTLIEQGTRRYSTTFQATTTGGEFLFTSGPLSNPWGNKWTAVTVSMNTIQDYIFQGSGNNSIVTSIGKYYSINFKDSGYNNTKGIVMETSNQPITFSSVTQSPANGSVFGSTPVTVNIVASSGPSPEEIIYVRYSTDNYTNSTLVPVTFTGVNGTATIPAQAGGTNVNYYVLSTTVANPAISDIDMYTLRYNNNGSTYGYTVSSGNPSYNVTFQVNMSEQTVSASGVHIAGSFQGWNPSSTQMTDADNDGIYTYTA